MRPSRPVSHSQAGYLSAGCTAAGGSVKLSVTVLHGYCHGRNDMELRVSYTLSQCGFCQVELKSRLID